MRILVGKSVKGAHPNLSVIQVGEDFHILDQTEGMVVLFDTEEPTEPVAPAPSEG